MTVVRKWDESENPHGDLQEVLPGIYRVQSTHKNKIWNMYVYPLMRGGLLIINPMVVRKDVLDAILKLGQPSVLICLSDNLCPVHIKDVYVWRKKFPESIFVCPNSAYRRLVRDIPLVYLRDLTIEIQMHYDDVQIIFPTADKKELHMLLMVKDDCANTSTPHYALLAGDMLVGSNEPNGPITEDTTHKLFSLITRDRNYTSQTFHKVAKENIIVGILPSHGCPMTDSTLCTTTRKSSSSASISTTNPTAARKEAIVACETQKQNSKAHKLLIDIANSFGKPEKTEKKEN